MMSKNITAIASKGVIEKEAAASFNDLVETAVSRRTMLRGGLGVAVITMFGSALTACGGGSGGASEALTPASTPAADLNLNFDAVATTSADMVSLPPGHSAQVLYAYGDPFVSTLSQFSNNGTEPSSEFDFRAGDHHDGMYFFGVDAAGNLDKNASDRGILCVNHENITQELMHQGAPSTFQSDPADASTLVRTVVDEVRKEQRAHGISCVEVIRDNATGQFAIVLDSPFNRRITTLTPTVMSGPAAGSPLLQTAYSPDGMAGRGTINNCANGFTPWGTYLTCEENYDLYFRDERGFDGANRTPAVLGFDNFQSGIGVRVPGGLFDWATLAGNTEEIDNEFGRFNVAPTGVNAALDFRNEGNQYGYVVEIDPMAPTAAPRKRTALGRFAHEGVWPSNFEQDGDPVVFYMGDDDNLQFIYKFVSANTFDTSLNLSPLETGDFYMDNGTLFCARFDFNAATGVRTGEWIPMTVDSLATANASGQFAGLFSSLDSIIVHSRAASFSLCATPMDRPEWGAVNPLNGEVYFTLTNNTDRINMPDEDVPAAIMSGNLVVAPDDLDEVTEFFAGRVFGATPTSPRGRNDDGEIIRIREDGDTAAATTFQWELFVFGAPVVGLGNRQNISGLGPDNEFTDCDGLFFDDSGLLWIQTDGGQPNGNNQMLAAIPGVVGDGGVTPANVSSNLRRFLVGPVACEITGIDITPDRRSLFINIQHPGQADEVVADDPATFVGGWPNGSDATAVGAPGVRARSATVVITRDDGGELGADFLNPTS
ncbi:MAG: phosphatase [Gammaproteobacteria bacterium]|nr:DUF839 domain-containing protein [bacterium AH-315-E07]PCH61137.1 MAG: phosphatase [Gammaproteobacteria bacterium]